jgi:predicted dehydrogenase
MGDGRARVGVVGVGLHGEMHLQAFSTYDRCRLTCVCDLNADRARAMAEKYRCDWTTDVAELARSDVDGVSIATPDFAHLAPALQLIDAGKHLLVEKPLTTDPAEGKRLVDAGRDRGVKVMVNLSNRWNPKYIAAKEAIVSGRIGKPVMGYARLSNTISVPTGMLSWATQSGPEWFLFPHSIDIVRWLLGTDATRVYASGTKEVLARQGIDVYDTIQAIVHFGETHITFETAWILPNAWPSVVDSVTALVGTTGVIKIDQNDQGMEIASDRMEFVAPYGRFDSHGKLFGFYLEGIRHFVDCLVDGRDPLVPGEDGLAVTRIIAAIRQSLKSGMAVDVAPS